MRNFNTTSLINTAKAVLRVVFLIWAILLTILFFHNMLITDLTVVPAHNYSHKNKTPVYLISYAAGPHVFHKNQNTLALSVLNRGVDVIVNYRRELLGDDFIKQYSHILDLKPGGGYWLWKPWIILDVMSKAPKDAIIIYADTSFVFNSSLMPLVNQIGDKDGLLLEYDDVEEFGTIERTVQRQTLIANNCDTIECRNAPHIWAGLLIVKNNANARKFIEQWFELCKNPKFLIAQTQAQTQIQAQAQTQAQAQAQTQAQADAEISQHAKFVGHQNDEALLCLTQYLQQHNFLLYPVSSKLIPEWEHRKYQDDEYYSLRPHINRRQRFLGIGWFGVERRLLNLAPFRWLRKHFFGSSS